MANTMASQEDKPKWVARNFRKPSKRGKAEKKPLVIRRVGRPTEWTEEAIREETEALREWIQDPDNYYFDAFLCERSLSREHINHFCKASKEFLDTVEMARRVQEMRLVQNALTKEHDGNFTKFVLANRAGWKERTEVSGDVKNPLSFVLGAIDSQSKDIIDVTPGEGESPLPLPSSDNA